MSKKKGIIRLVVLLAVIAFVVYTAVSGLGSDRSGSLNDISLGLDLRGGVSITYEAVGDVNSQDMSDTKAKLEKRVQDYSTEAQVYFEGSDRITVDIPGATDANAVLQELGKPGTLIFRGVPMMAPVIEQVKQLERYLNAELTASLISSMFTLFITSDPNDNNIASAVDDSVEDDEQTTSSTPQNALHMRAGAIYELAPGQKPEGVSPTRNNSAFSTFVDAVCTQIGASVEMPKEILLKAFTKSYSASRGALTEYWRKIPRARRDFIADFCQPVYEAFLAEAIAIGRIEAPGFFDDPVIRASWCKCNWIGSTMQQLDPLKEVSAAEKRILLNLSTQEREAAEFNGSDWNENIIQRKREVAACAELIAMGGEQESKTDEPDPNAPPEGDEEADNETEAMKEEVTNDESA